MSSQRKRIIPLALLLCGAYAFADEMLLVQVTQVTADGFYVDAGSERGLKAGTVGDLLHEGKEVGRAEIVAISRGSARLRPLGGENPVEGDQVRFLSSPPAPPDIPEPGAKKPDSTEPFVPLLERIKVRPDKGGPENLFHGRLSFSQLVQGDQENGLDYWSSILASDGSLDRIGGGPWGLRWAGNLSARGGEAFTDSILEGMRLDLYELSLGRRLESGGEVRAGRFFPRALSAVGTLDGVQVETPMGEDWRVGGLLGLRPEHDDLAPSLDEPTIAGYATLARGARDATHFSGTAGLVATYFDGGIDRVALLADFSLASGPDFRLDASLEIDFEAGDGRVRSGTQLTRGDIYASWQVAPTLLLRAGVDHWQQLDTRTEQDALGTSDPALFDTGYVRPWFGGAVDLATRTRLDFEVATIHPDATDPHWRLTLSQRDPLSVEGAYASLTAYNVQGSGVEGVGGQLALSLPVSANRWYLYSTLGYRAFDDIGDSFSLTDFQLRAEYRPLSKWSFHAGLQYSVGDAVDRILFDIGATLHW